MFALLLGLGLQLALGLVLELRLVLGLQLVLEQHHNLIFLVLQLGLELQLVILSHNFGYMVHIVHWYPKYNLDNFFITLFD